MSNRNKDNKPGVFLSQRPRIRNVDMSHYKPETVTFGGVHHHCATHNREVLIRQVWDGREALTPGVPSNLGRALHNPHLGYGVVPDTVNLNKNAGTYSNAQDEAEGMAFAQEAFAAQVG